MKTHIQIVAALHIALGALSLLAAIAVFAFMGMASGIVISQGGDRKAAGIVGIVGVAVGGFLAVIALPGIIGGWALFVERPWGRPMVLVLGII